MAWTDLLSAEGRQKFRIRRATKTLLERYAQSEMRMEAAEKLINIGTPDALYALVRRFSATSENLGVDQDEKKRVRDMLISFGIEAIDPVKRYIRDFDKITFAIDVLKNLESQAELLPYLCDILKDGDPVHIRGEKATQILKALESIEELSIVDAVLPCLGSTDDTVRYAAVECLEVHADERAREPMLEALTSEEEDSARVQMRIVEALSHLRWEVKGYRKKVAAMIQVPYRVTSKGLVVQ